MRILYLNTTYAGGGAERVTRQIYEGMKKRGHEVWEIVCYNRKGEVEDQNIMVLYRTPLQKIWQRLLTHNRNNESMTIPYAVHKICRFRHQRHSNYQPDMSNSLDTSRSVGFDGALCIPGRV